MYIRRNLIFLILFVSVALGAGCSTDPEGPVTAKFIDDGSYPPSPGKTFCYIDTLRSVSVIRRATNVGGYSSLLKLGKQNGVRFETLLLSFNFDSLANHGGKTVSSAIIDFPVRIYPGAFGISIGFYELASGFSEEDSLTSESMPDTLPGQIPDSLGLIPERIISSSSINTFSVNPDIVQSWVDGTKEPWPDGIAVKLQEEPDSTGFFEFNSIDYGSDPIALRVKFVGDTTTTSFAVEEDYCVPSYEDQGGYPVIGGLSSRLFFEFDLAGLPDSATVHYSSLVLNVEGSEGYSITSGEQEILGLAPEFYYYLYAPDSSDTGSDEFWEGTGVDVGSFYAELSDEIRFPLRGFTGDVIDGDRVNNGLVFQCDVEGVRFQKAQFYNGPDVSKKPYILVIYSLPADFDPGTE